MKKISLIFFLLISFAGISSAQINITGKVTDADTQEPVAGANVFISNTSYVTIADGKGNFSFQQINIQKGEMVINALGYSHAVYSITGNNLNNISVTLKQKIKELETVVVRRYDKEGYQKWGQLFFNAFIGNIAEGMQCSISDTRVLKFSYDNDTQVLQVDATEPIVIENKALGYTIEYTLENFTYDEKNGIISYWGYPAFKEMAGSAKKQKKWELKRKECYEGSVLHFMRSIYRNRVAEEGFTVQAVHKVLNEEKVRVKTALAKNNFTLADIGKGNMIGFFPVDTIIYYKNISRMRDSVFAVASQILPTDSFAFATDSTTAGIFFKNRLSVTYKNREATDISAAAHNSRAKSFRSIISLLQPVPLEIYASGNYYDPLNLFTEEYWAFFEKICRLLPYDFVYKNKEK